MIDLVNVTHHYGVRPVLRDVTMHVAEGELVAAMGPNGTGKTTLMGVMAGALAPLKGYVEIGGKRRRRTMDEERAVRKMVAWLPADAWVPPGRTGREWLLAVGRLYEIEDDRLMDHADRLLALFDLEKQADAPTGSYSTGQKKKMALCCALVTEAPVLLLDEPFSGGLDPSGILALKRVLQHLARERRTTIVMATPVPELVEGLADRVAVLKDGRLLAYDTIDGLRRMTSSLGLLDDVYERLVNPQTQANIDRYFAGRGGGLSS